MSQAVNHVHKYRRKNLTRNPKKEPYYVFACTECSHTIRTDLIVGKTARCFKCNSEFVVDSKKASTMAKLRCNGCIKHKEATLKLKEDIDKLLDNILNGLE